MKSDRSLAYQLLRGTGVAVMVLALGLSFFLPLSEHIKYGIVAVVGFAGYGLTELAKQF